MTMSRSPSRSVASLARPFALALVAVSTACALPPPDIEPPDDRACGGLQGLSCDSNEFCNFAPEAICGAADATGICTKRPEVCTEEYAPVCGCDDKTYGNACAANAAGVSVAASGECKTGPSAASCDPRELRCRRAAPACPEGQVPSITDGCYGPCVSIEACVCDEPEDCANTDVYTCHMHRGHCGPYVN